jgi:hypothetical protein
MTERVSELRGILAEVRARWQRRALLEAWALGALTAAAMVGVGLLAVWLVASEGVPLVLVVAAVTAVAVTALIFAVLSLRQTPSDRQIARFIEERAGGLDEVLVTAVDRSVDGSAIAGVIVNDAVRAARDVDIDRIVSRDVLRRAAAAALGGTLAFAVALWFFAPAAGRAVNVAGAYLFPHRYAIDVRPGSVKVRAGEPVTVVARMRGVNGAVVPTLTVGKGDAARSARMTPGAAPEEFTLTLNNIAASFPYVVTAGSATSPEFTVDVIKPVRISSIDVRYEYPSGIGLEPHIEQNGGDIFAPAGTKVQLTINTDKQVANGQLKLADGQAIDLQGHNQVFSADLTVAKDGSYRVALNDVDGLRNDGDTEYFIRMLNDRPPDVRILRPAGDKQVSPLEEVVIEARADDDYGVRSLELVIKSNAGKEKVIPLSGAGTPAVAAGQHTVFLEELNVKPGDVVTYHARATDVGRGRRSTESRSDIFFLEVKPYEEEFFASESNAGGMAGMENTGLEELIAQQKDVMAATWKLDARARRGGPNARSPQDIRAIGQAQTALRDKTEEVSQQISAQMAQQRRRLGARAGLTRPGDEPLPKAVEAMGRAAAELQKLNIAPALPHEEKALAELLKAAAEIRRRQVQMQQANGGGGNGNRNQPDLSTLFDQQLRKQQQTNYETQSTTQEANKPQNQEQNDPLAAIRELARRQEALSRQQRDLAKNQAQMSPEERKRQLERLTRDQEELRQQAEELSKQMQGGSSSSQGGGQRASGSNSEQMREISEQMRNAAGDLRNQDPQQASARGSKAGEQLRGLEQRMQGTRPEERRRAMGDLQLEAQQIADAQRRLGNEASRTTAGATGDDARRKLAAEQERLADRAQRLGESARQLSQSAEAEEQQALADAGREIDKQRIAERMRESAQSMRSASAKPSATASARADKSTPTPGDEPAEIARALDHVAERLGDAAGGRDGETSRLSEQLSRAQELRDRLARLQRSMEELQQQGAQSAQSAQSAQGATGAEGAQGTQSAQNPSGAQPQPGSRGQEGSSGQQGSNAGGRGSVERLQRDVDNQMRDAQRLAEELRREPGMEKGGTTPEQWQRSVSAPGTEGFKQDFAKWESLKKNLLVALEQTESKLADQLRARETRERLNAGRHDAVADTYRELVDRYYQSLAAPRRQVR